MTQPEPTPETSDPSRLDTHEAENKVPSVAATQRGFGQQRSISPVGALPVPAVPERATTGVTSHLRHPSSSAPSRPALRSSGALLSLPFLQRPSFHQAIGTPGMRRFSDALGPTAQLGKHSSPSFDTRLGGWLRTAWSGLAPFRTRPEVDRMSPR